MAMAEALDIRLVEGRARAEDARRLAAGEVTPEQLQRENAIVQSAEDILFQPVAESMRHENCRKYITMLAALRETYSARQFEARHPGVIAWSELVPRSIRQMPWDSETRRAIDQLEETTQSRGIRI
jgi:hypothetical protein